MASTVTKKSNLKNIELIWLDNNIDVEEIRYTERGFRSIIKHIRKFQDAEPFRKCIEERSNNDRLIIVVTGRLGQEIVPHIHSLEQIASIYVYCMNKEEHEQWAVKYTKVK